MKRNWKIEKLDPEIFTKTNYRDDREILKRYTLFRLWKEGYVLGYTELSKVLYKPTMFIEDKVAIMFNLNENNYLRDRLNIMEGSKQFWFYFSKDVLEVTKKMIANYKQKKKDEKVASSLQNLLS